MVVNVVQHSRRKLLTEYLLANAKMGPESENICFGMATVTTRVQQKFRGHYRAPLHAAHPSALQYTALIGTLFTKWVNCHARLDLSATRYEPLTVAMLLSREPTKKKKTERGRQNDWDMQNVNLKKKVRLRIVSLFIS